MQTLIYVVNLQRDSGISLPPEAEYPHFSTGQRSTWLLLLTAVCDFHSENKMCKVIHHDIDAVLCNEAQ